LKRIDLTSLLPAASNIALFAEMLFDQTRKLGGGRGMAELDSDTIIAVFMKSLASVLDTATWLELPATKAACERCHLLVRHWRPGHRILVDRNQGEQIAGACHQISTAMSDELERHHAYVVAPLEGKLIDDGIGMFGLEVVTRFPDTRQDIAAAAKCRAYELWTACVMHLMRVGEIGVLALADHLQVKRGVTWGGTIANINEALKDTTRMKGDPAGKVWAAETGTYLNFVKDAFRNPAMHPERNFGAREAAVIFENMRAFMQMLAKRIAASPMSSNP
jgi:hypothetical protein